MSIPVTLDDFSLILGYPRTPLLNLGLALGNQNVNPDGSSSIPLNRLTRLQKLYADIVVIETQLDTARANSMAKTLGSLSLDYQSHIEELVATGHQKLEEIAAILNLPIYFDRFTGAYPQSDTFYSNYGRTIQTTSPYSYKSLI